jgi:hypothetical protein
MPMHAMNEVLKYRFVRDCSAPKRNGGSFSRFQACDSA